MPSWKVIGKAAGNLLLTARLDACLAFDQGGIDAVSH
jgi:putative component of membrane protein insertase Oxa1/YidC/SpoIIIJ protein YidD